MLRWSRATVGWLVWAVSIAAVLVGLGMQVRYAEEILTCITSDLLVLCSGPLPGWLMPMTVLSGLALVALAAWRLTSGARPSGGGTYG